MKKIISLTLLFVFVGCNVAFSQKEMNNWYFGVNAGLTFNSGSPVALTDGVLNNDEGSASISDRDGNLLFYTDGMNVWDKTHGLMPNGTGLLGDVSSAQSAIIVRNPGDDSIFYIVTAYTSVHYTTVDLRLNGGLGDVVTAEKNIQMLANSSEKVTVVKHANNVDYWVIARNVTLYYAFLIDCDGIHLPSVVSTPAGSISAETWGYMAASPDGSKLGTASRSGGVQIADFDNATGVVSNALTLQNPRLWPGLATAYGNYGICFSPNSKVLYASSIGNGALIQWDLTVSPIDNSKTLIAVLKGQSATIGGSYYNYLGGALQLGPDGKIYIAQFGKDSLAVINDPDVVGMGCNYEANAVFLDGKVSKLGLPNVTLPFFSEIHNNKPEISFDETCQDIPINFEILNYVDVDSVKWKFNDIYSSDDESTSLTPTYIFKQLGTYNVQVIRFIGCVSDTINKEIQIIECVLPIDLLSFDLKVTGQAVTCNWITASESNNKGFQIERSADGVHWSVLGFVGSRAKGGNSSSALDYSFTDNSPVTGQNYYRIKQTDLDGNFTYSRIRNIDFSKSEKISVYPNPATDQITINGLAGNESIEIFDMYGRMVYSRKTAGNLNVVSLQKLSSGVYQIQVIRKDGTRQSFRINKL